MISSPGDFAGEVDPGSSYYDAGSVVQVTAVNLTVNRPLTLTANFVAPGPTSLGGSIGQKTGPANARVWPIVIGNNGPGMAYGRQRAPRARR